MECDIKRAFALFLIVRYLEWNSLYMFTYKHNLNDYSEK
ncbi:Uncharacterised protein [Klebsiella pneumoniae]|nr:Uncharacterised protein [Klebsiella pneumoniae]